MADLALLFRCLFRLLFRLPGTDSARRFCSLLQFIRTQKENVSRLTATLSELLAEDAVERDHGAPVGWNHLQGCTRQGVLTVQFVGQAIYKRRITWTHLA
jgi:hypothetical protein